VERVRCLLQDLFRQVLSEHGREAPALTAISIESSVGRYDPRLVAYFSNGHRAEVAARTQDIYEFCDRLSMWDLDGLRRALANEAHEIYAQMVQGRQAEVGGPHHYEPLPAETLEPDTTGRLRAWWNRLRFIRGHRVLQAAEREAHDRGIRLLIKNLSPAQRAQYDAFGYFEVTGGETGKRYRITKAYQMNVLEIGKNGKRMRSLCFVPKGGLVLGDVMLAQKLALELFESNALAVANVITGRASPIFPLG
jgi:hypothetical protein